MRVPNYTKGLVLERAVPNQVDLGRIQEAGSTFEGAAKVLDTAGQIRRQVEVANELSAVNSAVIKKQRDDLDFSSQKRKERQDNPFNFAKDMELEYKKRDEEYKKTLPTESAKAFYQKDADRLNLRNFEDNSTWEVTRSVERLVNKADQSIGDLEVTAFRNGASFDKLNKDLQASMLPLEGMISSDEKLKLYKKGQERIASSLISGLIDRNPYEAKQALDSRQYDSALGAEKLLTLNNQADNAIEHSENRQKAEEKEEEELAQIENKSQYMDLISDPSVPSKVKIRDINLAQLKGVIRDSDARNMEAYVNSVEAINAVTNSALMADVVTKMHDLSSLADTNKKDYLIGIQNIKSEIMSLRADGTLSADDEGKLNNQMRTLTSAKTSDATNSIALSFGKAKKTIDTQLPPEYRGEAIRRLFYEVEGESVENEVKKTGKEYKAIYENKVNKVIDNIKLERRNKALQTTQSILTPENADAAFLAEKGYTEEDIQETADKYNLTREEVIKRLRGK